MKKYMKNPSLAVMIAAFGAGFFLFLFSIPPVGVGFWSQTELAQSLFCVAGAVMALGWLLLVRGRPRVAQRSFGHPLVVSLLAVGLWSFATLPFAPVPARGFLGAPQLGDGVAWWFAFAFFVLGAVTLWPIPKVRTWLVALALVGSGLCAAGSFLFTYAGIPTYSAFFFDDWMGLFAFCAFPLLAPFIPRQAQRWWSVLLIYGATIGFLYATKNLGAFVFGAGALPALYAFYRFVPLSAMARAKVMAGAWVLLPCTMLLLYAVTVQVMQGKYYAVMAESPHLYTLISRAYLASVDAAEVLRTPHILLTGQGAGMFDERLVVNLDPSWVDYTREAVSQWDGLTINHFHSHNIFLEALVAHGVVGFLAWLGMIALIPLRARRAQAFPAAVFAGGLSAIGSLWFFMILNVPLIALAIGAATSNQNPWTVPRAWQKPCLFLGIALCLASAAGMGTLAVRFHKTYPEPCLIEKAEEGCTTFAAPYDDFETGGLYLSRHMIMRSRNILAYKDETNKTKERREEMGRLNRLFAEALRYRAHVPEARRIRLTLLVVRGEVILGAGEFLTPAERVFYTQGWEEDLRAWLERAPHRTDVAVPFLMAQVLQDNDAALRRVSQGLYERNPEDPVGLWFTGVVALADPATLEEGKRRMRRALHNGIERFTPVEPEIVKMLGK